MRFRRLQAAKTMVMSANSSAVSAGTTVLENRLGQDLYASPMKVMSAGVATIDKARYSLEFYVRRVYPRKADAVRMWSTHLLDPSHGNSAGNVKYLRNVCLDFSRKVRVGNLLTTLMR